MTEGKYENVYVTERVLSTGIQFKQVREYGGGYVKPVDEYDMIYKTKWHRTFPEAKARAEEMRVKKIASLKKQITKLERMTFTDPAEKGTEQ